MAGKDVLSDFDRMLQQESGNRQTDRQGRTIRSPKGAVGAAQVMPSTGPEAARMAGLPWDPVRFEKDQAYNTALGRAFHNNMLQRFGGDRRAAAAAYNAGPGRVSKLQRQYGSDWERHLPAETRDYLAKTMGGGTVSRTQMSGSNTPVRVVDPTLPAPTPEPIRATPTQVAGTDVLDVFSEGPRQIKGAYDSMVQGDQKMGDVLAQSAQQLDEIQNNRVAIQQQAVQAKAAIQDDIANQTTELQQRVQPLFQKRAEVAQRRVELAEMNPLQRAFAGIFNRNYNKKAIDELDGALAGEIQAIGQEYEVTTNMQNTLLRVIEGKYADADSENQLAITNITQDLDIANQGMQVIRQNFANAMQGLNVSTEVVRAQVLMRNDALSKLTPGMVSTALAQARKGDGFAMIDGTPLSIAELDERAKQLQGQELALRGQQIGVQSAEISLQRNQEERLISHMSAAELDTAIKNGGMFRGVQLDQGMLTQAYQSQLQRSAAFAGQTAMIAEGRQITGVIDSFNYQMQDTLRRTQGLTGQRVPPAMQNFYRGVTDRVNQITKMIREAPEEQRMALRAQFVPEIRQLQAQQVGMIESIVNGMTNNKDARAVLQGFMTGQPLTAEQTTKGLLALTSTGGLPPGVRLSGPAGAAVLAAKKAADSVYARYGGEQNFQQQMAGAAKPNQANMQRELLQAVQGSVSRAWIGGQAKQILESIPQLAQQDGHPAGRIRPEDFRMARAAGDAAGIKAIAAGTGLTEQQAMQIFGPGGSKEAGWREAKKGTPAENQYGQVARNLEARQNSEMLRMLDASPSASQGFKPSTALVNYMKSDGFQNKVGMYNRNIGQSGFGEMMADSISAGALGETMYKYADSLGQQAGANDMADMAASRERAAAYRADPFRRARSVLGAIPGLNDSDEKKLLTGIRQKQTAEEGIGSLAANMIPVFGEDIKGRMDSSQIDSIILHGKFEDPGLERLRRIAAQKWIEYSDATDRAVDRLSRGDY